MKEKQVEQHFKWAVETLGGRSFKFVSPGVKGVADRVVCMPNGTTHFVELKTKGGRLSALQLIFAADMERLNQNYAVLWNLEQIDAYLKTLSK
jgi:hypothetical protein